MSKLQELGNPAPILTGAVRFVAATDADGGGDVRRPEPGRHFDTITVFMPAANRSVATYAPQSNPHRG
jgi:hypothetical protein